MTAIFSTLTKQVPDTLERGDDWRDFAACADVDPEGFFPIGEGIEASAQIEEAKATCDQCPVKSMCRDWALTTRQEYGVWGGMTEKERRAWHRQKALTAPPANPNTSLQTVAEELLTGRSVFVGGHREWRGPNEVRLNGLVTTAKRVAWVAKHGTAPHSALFTVCGHKGCIVPDHQELQALGAHKQLTAEELIDYRRDVFISRSVEVEGGHREWRFSQPVTVGSATFTARQLAWIIAHGSRPTGTLKVICGHKACISADHLRDRGQANTGCGTRRGYDMHLARKEPTCDACKAAKNADQARHRARTRTAV